MKLQHKADLSILMITLFWGTSYVLTKVGLNSLGELNLIALRFVIAFILSGLVFRRRLARANRRIVQAAFLLGALLFAVFVTMTYGVKNTSASNAGFLCNLAVVIVPVFSYLFWRQVPERRVLAGIGLSILGTALLALNSRLQISSGDLLCLLGSGFNAAFVVATGRLTRDVDSVALGVLQLGFVGLFSLVGSYWLETPHLPATLSTWLAVLALSLFCTAAGFIVQTVALQYTTPTHASLIITLETVFAALFAYLCLGERLTGRGYVGAAVILLSVLIAEVDLVSLVKPKIGQDVSVE